MINFTDNYYNYIHHQVNCLGPSQMIIIALSVNKPLCSKNNNATRCQSWKRAPVLLTKKICLFSLDLTYKYPILFLPVYFPCYPSLPFTQQIQCSLHIFPFLFVINIRFETEPSSCSLFWYILTRNPNSTFRYYFIHAWQDLTVKSLIWRCGSLKSLSK